MNTRSHGSTPARKRLTKPPLGGCVLWDRSPPDPHFSNIRLNPPPERSSKLLNSGPSRTALSENAIFKQVATAIGPCPGPHRKHSGRKAIALAGSINAFSLCPLQVGVRFIHLSLALGNFLRTFALSPGFLQIVFALRQ